MPWCSTETDSEGNYNGNWKHCEDCIEDCYSEVDVSYPGNDLNEGFDNRQSDAEACRFSCRSISGAKFFDWVGPQFHNEQYHNGCWCKTSDAGRMSDVGITVGNVNCSFATGTNK